MEHSTFDSALHEPQINNLRFWLNLFSISGVYSAVFIIAYVYCWPEIMQLTLSLTGSASSGETILKSFSFLEAALALTVFAYLQMGSKLNLSPKIYLELISLLLALRIIAGVFLGLEFFISLIPCLIVHSVIYFAAMGKKIPQKLLASPKNL